MSLAEQIFRYFEGVLIPWLLSLRYENRVKGYISFALKDNKGSRKTLRYRISVEKELRKSRISEDTRIATGIITVNVVRGISKAKGRGLNSRQFPKAEILLRGPIPESSEKEALVEAILTTAPKGSVPLYLIEIAMERLEDLLQNVKEDLEGLSRNLAGFEISKVEVKINVRKSSLNVLDVLRNLVEQVFSDALDEDSVKSFLIQLRRRYGILSPDAIEYFKNLYIGAYRRVLNALATYLELLRRCQERKEILRAFLKAFPKPEKAKTHLRYLLNIAVEFMSPNDYIALKNTLCEITRGSLVDISRLEDIIDYGDVKLLGVFRKYENELPGKLPKLITKIKRLSRDERTQKHLETLIDYVFSKVEKLSPDQKLLVLFAIISSLAKDERELSELLSKLYTYFVPKKSVVSELFETLFSVLMGKDDALSRSNSLLKLLEYPANIKGILDATTLGLALVLAYSERELYLRRKGLISRDDKEFLAFIESISKSFGIDLKISKNMAKVVLKCPEMKLTLVKI